MKKILVVIAIMMLSGCATHYAKPGTSNDQMVKDRWDCQRDAAIMSHGHVIMEAYYEVKCMQMKGYK